MTPATADSARDAASSDGGAEVLVRDDGLAIAFGWNADGRCDVPPLVPGLGYVGCAAGARHTILVRSDGTAVAIGDNSDGQCKVLLCAADPFESAAQESPQLVIPTFRAFLFRDENGPKERKGMRGKGEHGPGGSVASGWRARRRSSGW